jgi:hypothetical protein
MIFTSGLGKIQVKYVIMNSISTFSSSTISILLRLCLYCRMKLGLQPSRLLNLMPSLGVVQSNTGNSKVMNLTNSCHTSSLALYLWRVVSPLGSKSPRRKSLKHGCIFAKEREVFGLNRYGRFHPPCCTSLSVFILTILNVCFVRSGSFCSFVIKSR